MAEYICECQICHVRDIKRSEMVEEVDYIHKGTKYYHKKCYDNWKKAQPDNDEDYVDLIYDYIARDLKVTYDYWVCEAQRKKFLKEKMTNKGILFALKYFYDIKHGDWEKGHGGIGIVPFVYNDARAYWSARERHSEGTIAEIERQMRAAAERHKETVQKRHITPRKFKVDFSVLDNLEDDE